MRRPCCASRFPSQRKPKRVARSWCSTTLTPIAGSANKRRNRGRLSLTPETHLLDNLGELISFSTTVGNESVHLPLEIRAIFRCRYAGIDGDGYRLLRCTTLLTGTDHTGA